MGYFCVEKTEQGVYASCFEINAFVEIIGNRSKVLGSFRNEKNIDSLHRRIIKNNNLIFFVPKRAKAVSYYNLFSKEMKYINICSKNEEVSIIADAKLYEGKIYMFPKSLEQNLKILDIETLNIEERDDYRQKLIEAGMPVKQEFDTYSVAQYGKTFWIVPFKSNKVIKYDIKTGDITIKEFEVENLRNISISSQYLWINCFNEATVVRINRKNGESILIRNTNDGVKDYHRVLCYKERIFLLPVKGYEIDEIVDGSNIVAFYTNNKYNNCKDVFGDYYIDDKGMLCFLPLIDTNVKKIDLNNNMLHIIEFDETEIIKKKAWEQIKEERILNESDYINLNDLMWGISHD